MTQRAGRAVDAAAVLVCAALACLYVTRHFVNGDEATFAACAQRMAAFHLPPYAGGWEHKPPLVFWTYETLLGSWPGDGMLWIHAANAAAWIATAVLSGIAASRLLGRAAFAPTVIAYALLRSLWETKAGTANTEAFQAPLLTASIVLFLADSPKPRRTALAAGALLGLAAMFKQPALIFGPACVAAVLVVRGRKAALVAALAGGGACIAVLAAFALVLSRQDVLDDAFWLNGPANRIYITHGPPTTWRDTFAGYVEEPMRALAPWVLAAIAAAAAFVRPRIFGDDASRVRRWAGALAILFATGLASAGLGGNFFHHYWWPLYPVLAVAAAAGVVACVRWGSTRRARIAGGAVAAVIVGALWLPAQRVDKSRLARSFLFDDAAEPEYEKRTVRDAAAAIRALTADGDSIFVWGHHPELYLLSGRPSATRHVFCAFLTGTLRWDVRTGAAPPDPDLVPGAWDKLDADLDAARPRVIVDTSGTGYRHYDLFPVAKFSRLAARLARDYALAATQDGYAIYVRR